jgi:anti-sigma regulatory factor (Ser/Thr protein kinase)
VNTRFGFRLRPSFDQARALRSGVRERLEPLGVSEQDVGRLILVVDEMVSNAIEHGHEYRRDGDLLTVRIGVDPAFFDVEFIDPAVPTAIITEIEGLLAQCRGGVPPLDNERGRGLFLIQDGLESLDLLGDPGGRGLRVRGRMRRSDS